MNTFRKPVWAIPVLAVAFLTAFLISMAGARPVLAEASFILPVFDFNPGQELQPGQPLTVVYSLGNLSGAGDPVPFSSTIKLDQNAIQSAQVTVSDGELTQDGDSTYVWSGKISARAVVTMTLTAKAGQQEGQFDEAFVFATPGGQKIEKALTISARLPKILAVMNPAVVRENITITGTNLLSGTNGNNGKPYIFMRLPMNPLGNLVIPFSATTWENGRITFVMPDGQSVIRGARYLLTVWNGKYFSNEVEILTSSGWTQSITAPADAASGDVITYTLSVTNTGREKHIALTKLQLDSVPFVAESIVISGDGELRVTNLDGDKKNILWAADVLPGKTITLIIRGEIAPVLENTLFESVLLWIWPDNSGSGTDLAVVPDGSVENQVYLPLINR